MRARPLDVAAGHVFTALSPLPLPLESLFSPCKHATLRKVGPDLGGAGALCLQTPLDYEPLRPQMNMKRLVVS